MVVRINFLFLPLFLLLLPIFVIFMIITVLLSDTQKLYRNVSKAGTLYVDKNTWIFTCIRKLLDLNTHGKTTL